MSVYPASPEAPDTDTSCDAALQEPATEPFRDAVDHLLFELHVLELRVRLQVLRLRAAQLLQDDDLRGLYIPDSQVDALLAGRDGRPGALGEDPPVGAVSTLRRHLAALEEEQRRRLALSRRAGVELPLARLAERFDLSEFERSVLILALAPEIERRWETLYAYVQNDVTRKRPTVALALDLLASGSLVDGAATVAGFTDRLARRRDFAADAPLLRHRLLHLVEDPQDRPTSLLARALALPPRVAGFLLQDGAPDPHLRDVLLPSATAASATADDPADRFPAELAARLRAAAPLLAAGGVVLLHGPYGSGRRTAAEDLARRLERPLLAASVPRLLAGDDFAAGLARLWREARLTGAAVALEGFEALLEPGEGGSKAAGERLHALLRQTTGQPGWLPAVPVLLLSATPWEPAGSLAAIPFAALELSPPPPELRRRLWRRALAEGGGLGTDPGTDLDIELETEVRAVAEKFALTPGRIVDAARRAHHRAASGGGNGPGRLDLHAAARSQSHQGLQRHGQKLEPRFGWRDLVLPAPIREQLEDFQASVEHRARVHGDWGFHRRLALGTGIQALFSGPSGTGKTLAATVLARELGLDLFRIDLSKVVSKWIGETEKNLAQVFDDAQTSNAILFFDECEALFGKRSEVRDSHDRHANIEIAYLLQRMEEYDGVSILATNLRKNLDEAFARRLQHTIEFPAPDAECRRLIWRRMFPAAAPLADDVDLDFLAERFELTGGNIKNVALAAAFLAAREEAESAPASSDDGATVITMGHLILATARELKKIGRLPTQAEFRQYFGLIRRRG